MRAYRNLPRLTVIAAFWVIAAVIATTYLPPVYAGPQDPYISFNKAPAEEFLKIMIVDVPEAVARAIVSYREANGPYKQPEDLKKVPGMTEELYDALDPMEVDGDIVFEKAGGPGGMNAY